MGKVFTKLGTRSRSQLEHVLLPLMPPRRAGLAGAG
jgi:hypothetical protein